MVPGTIKLYELWVAYIVSLLSRWGKYPFQKTITSHLAEVLWEKESLWGKIKTTDSNEPFTFFRRGMPWSINHSRRFRIGLPSFLSEKLRTSSLATDDKNIRIVYRLLQGEMAIVEIWGIGKREKSKIYQAVDRRVRIRKKKKWSTPFAWFDETRNKYLGCSTINNSKRERKK